MKHTYLIYILVYETLVLGGFGYVVFGLNRDPWWILLGLILSSCAYSPAQWAELSKKEDTDGGAK